MTTVERIKSICKERRIPLSKLEKELGFANGYLGQLKKGTLPDDRLNKISDYLKISPIVLSERKEDPAIKALMYIKSATPEFFKLHFEYMVSLYVLQYKNDAFFRKEILQC